MKVIIDGIEYVPMESIKSNIKSDDLKVKKKKN